MDGPVLEQDGRWMTIDTPIKDGGRDAFVITGLTGEEHLSGLFEFELDLLCYDPAVPAKSLVGKPITVTLETIDGTPRYVHGYVNELSFRGTGDHGSMYHARIVPWLWFLTLNSDCRIFQNQTVPQIITQVLGARGIAELDASQITGHHPEREYCVQYRESDFTFVSRLMEEEGIHYHFQHEDGKHVMMLADTNKAFEDCHESEVEYLARESAGEVGDQISSWEHRYAFTTGRVAHTDYNFATPTLPLMNSSKTLVDLDGISDFERYEFPARLGTPDDTAAIANVRMEEMEARYDTVLAESKCMSFTAGGVFMLVSHDAAHEADKSYTITSVRHEARQPAAFVTGGDHIAQQYSNEFVCIPADTTFRPLRRTPKPTVRGAQTAVVVGPDGSPVPSAQEIHTDKYARVQVRFHWARDPNDATNLNTDTSSCWMRVAQPTAGKGWGTVTIPRIGHEVLIHFLEGDPDQPLVMGSVYNAENMPPISGAGRTKPDDGPLPQDAVQAAMQTSLRSNSLGGSGGHNEITMNDTGGNEGMYIKAQKNEIHDVGNDRRDTVANDETVSIGNDQKIDVGNDRTETVGNNEDITIGVNRTESVGTNETVNIGVNRSHTIGTSDTLSVGSNQTTTVGMMANESVGATKTTNVGAAYAVTVGGAMNTAVGLAQFEEVGLTKKVIAGSSIEFICGASSMKLDSGGKVTISGTDFDFTASGPVKINGSVIDLN